MLQLSQRPLTASSRDSELFSGRKAELDKIRRSLDLGFNIYISGSAGSGKTSLLRQVQRLLDEQRHLMVTNRTESVQDFALALADVGNVATPTGDLEAVLELLADSDHPPTTILVDDVTQMWELFGQHRDELWQFPFRWVVTGRLLTLPAPADTFFETTINLDWLEADEIRELIHRRILQSSDHDDPVEQLNTIAERLPAILGRATPRQVLSAVQSLLVASNLDQELSSLSAAKAGREELDPTTRLVFDALEANGPMHAGDPKMLEQVGVSRSRVVQILKELENDGRVRSHREGKRKIYERIGGWKWR